MRNRGVVERLSTPEHSSNHHGNSSISDEKRLPLQDTGSVRHKATNCIGSPNRKKRLGSKGASGIASATVAGTPTNLGSAKSGRLFAYVFLGCLMVVGVLQVIINALLFHGIDEDATQAFPKKASMQQQIDVLQTQLRSLQQKTEQYADDGDFYAFSIRDSRRLVPTQLSSDFHIWDYLDITSPNQQSTKRSNLFHNAVLQGPAVCQKYDLYCYKKKIVQVFEMVLAQNPHTNFFFYMEADNDLCVPMTEIRRLSRDYPRYFISTGIGFSGWIMRRDFMHDFLVALKGYVSPPKDPNDVLDQQGPRPSEGPDPIAADMLAAKNSWTVTRKYLVSHSIQPSLGNSALTVRMPEANSGATASVGINKLNNQTQVQPKAQKLQKHLPRCFEPRRSKWRVSLKDHRDRFGWDYFDYDECDGEVFPCYDGQLQDLLAKDMIKFNYTKLDIDRQKLIAKQEERERKRLLEKQASQQKGQNSQSQSKGISEVSPQSKISANRNIVDARTAERVKSFFEAARGRKMLVDENNTTGIRGAVQ